MGDPVDLARRTVEDRYSICDIEDKSRVRRTMGKSHAASSLSSCNFWFVESFGHGRENWLKSVKLTPTFVGCLPQVGRLGSLIVNSAHLWTFAPSHLQPSGMLRRSSLPSFALANP